MPLMNFRNQALASYVSNAFCIKISKDISIINQNKDQLEIDIDSLDDFSIFAHEYWHYLINMSTLTGYKDFKLFGTLIDPFWNGIDEKSGTFNSNNLSKNDREYADKILDLYLNIYGDSNLNNISPRVIDDLKIEDYDVIDKTLFIDEGDAKFTNVVLNLAIDTKFGNKKKDFYMGTLAIDEGLAYLIESMISDTDSDLVPDFPYKVLEKLGKHIIDKDVSKLVIAKIALLSMLTLDAPSAIILFMEQYSNLVKEKNANSDEIINFIWENYKPRYKNLIKKVGFEFNNLVNIYNDRGLLEYAIDYLRENYENLLNKRLENPFFDLEFLTNNELNLKLLIKLFKDIVPCDSISEREGKEDKICKDLLISFTDNNLWKESNHTPTEFLRVLQCQLHYLNSHLTKNGFIYSKNTRNNPCPFYTICNLETRINNKEICKENPWEVFTKNPSKSCWYGVAVTSTLGTVNID